MGGLWEKGAPGQRQVKGPLTLLLEEEGEAQNGLCYFKQKVSERGQFSPQQINKPVHSSYELVNSWKAVIR